MLAANLKRVEIKEKVNVYVCLSKVVNLAAFLKSEDLTVLL